MKIFTTDIVPRGYSGVQVKGMIEGFFGFEMFHSGIFSGRKIWQVFFYIVYVLWISACECSLVFICYVIDQGV